MAEEFEILGVEAVAAGVDSFLSSLKRMEAAFDSTSQKFASMGPAATSAESGVSGFAQQMLSTASSMTLASGTLGGLSTLLGAFTGPVGAAVAGVSLLKGGIDLLGGALNTVFNAWQIFDSAGTRMAGRFQEMEISALAVGRSMGLQEEAIRGGIEGMKEAGIRYDIAASTVAQFARNQIDLAKSAELVKVAQGAAILMGEDSSATMQRLTWAITTQDTMMLRNLGIMTDMSDALDKYAKSIDKPKEALTGQERAMVAVNEVITKGAAVAGIYAEAMKSPTKALRTLTEREIPEFQAALGAPFLGAWFTVISSIRHFVGALEDAASEGGALYPILVNIGAGASILADMFSSALGVVTNFITSVSTDLTTGFGDIIVGMAQWGAEMVSALAEGIVSASSSVLVEAMNFIGSVMSMWLAPGSPPKIAPDLIKWGVDTMSEYLHGMTQVDFGVLKKIQAPLKQVLGGKELADLSAEMIKALSQGGLTEDIFQRIETSAGLLGTEIGKLARNEWALAEASKAVADAERQVVEGRKKAAALTSEYNNLVREGAAPDVLKAKLAELNAAEQSVAVAEAQAVQAQENISSLQEQAELQGIVVDQLMELSQAAVPEVAKAAKEAGAGAAAKAAAVAKAPKVAAALPEVPLPIPAKFDIKSKISEAIDEAKAALMERVQDIFQPFVDAWERLKSGPLSEIAPAFQNLWSIVRQAWEQFWTAFEPSWTSMKQSLSDFWERIQPELLAAWEAISDAWTQLAALVGEILTPALAALGIQVGLNYEEFGTLAGVLAQIALNSTLGGIEIAVAGLTAAFNSLAGGLAWIREQLDLAKQTFNEFMSGISQVQLPSWLTPGSPTPFEMALGGILESMQTLNAFAPQFTLFTQWRMDLEYLMMTLIPMFVSQTVYLFTSWRDQVVAITTQLSQTVISLFRAMTTSVVASIVEMIASIMAALDQFAKDLPDKLGETIGQFVEMGERSAEAVDKIKDRISSLNKALDKLIDKAKEAKKALEEAGLMAASPSRLELGIGGAVTAMRQLSTVELPRLAAAMAARPAAAPIAAASMPMGSVTVPITAHIYNATDLASFQALTEQSVRKALGPRR